MPIYEYRCLKCDRSFEALVRNGHDGAQCPHCRGTKLAREMSTFAALGSNGAADSAIESGSAASGRMCGGSCGNCGCH
jgi:putative FmdB family regulatory protein